MFGRTGLLLLVLFCAAGEIFGQSPKARAAFEAGMAQQAKGAHAEAVAQFSAALAASRNYPAALRARALSYTVLGQDNLALADLDQALAAKPDDLGAWNARGDLHLRRGEFEKAASDFSQVLGQHSDPMLRLRRGTAYRGLGRLKEARGDLDQAIAANPQDSEAYYQRGLVSVAQKQWPAAKNDLDQAIALNPDFVPAYYDRGLALQKLGSQSAAIADLSHYLEHAPNHAGALRARAESYVAQGDTVKAEADRKRAADLEPSGGSGGAVTAPVADASMVNSARPPVTEQSPAVVSMFEPEKPTAPHQPELPKTEFSPQEPPSVATVVTMPKPAPIEAPAGLPAAAPSIATPPAAAALARSARAATPPTPAGAAPAEAQAHNLKGRALNAQDKYSEAIAEFDVAIKLDPTLAQAWNSRGYARLRTRRVREAIADLTKAIELNPNYKNAYHNRAIAKRALRDIAGADADEAIAAKLVD